VLVIYKNVYFTFFTNSMEEILTLEADSSLRSVSQFSTVYGTRKIIAVFRIAPILRLDSIHALKI
jgi:hypothetical protein